MMPRKDLIARKLAMIGGMVESLRRNERVLARIGGYTIETKGEEVLFQEARIANLQWALNAQDADIEARMAELKAQLLPDERKCIHGVVRGLRAESILSIALIEDLEIALGVHPGVIS